MLDQNIFTETVREVSEIVRAAAEPLSREEILRYFDKMELNEAQKEMVLEYLLKLVETEDSEGSEDPWISVIPATSAISSATPPRRHATNF